MANFSPRGIQQTWQWGMDMSAIEDRCLYLSDIIWKTCDAKKNTVCIAFHAGSGM